MIVWSGKGIFTVLSLVLGAVTLAILEPIIPIVRTLGAGFVFLVAGGFNHLFLKVVPFTKVHPDRSFVDQETGQVLRVSDEGSLFFIRRRFWTYILLALGVVFSVVSLFSN